MTLHDIRGHEAVRRSLARARLAGSLPAALLVHGPPGVGKQRLALWVARLLLCETPDENGPCGQCRQCRLALKLEHPDVHWHFPLPRPRGVGSDREKLADALEEARWSELAELRRDPLRPSWSEEPRAHYLAAARTLRRRAQQRPSMAASQVFIIGDAETLVPQESSPEAANALLKLLEEPPEGTRFILTSSEPGRLLGTIRSRCLPLHLPPLPHQEVESFLVDVAGVEPEEAARAARLSHGSIGRGLGFVSRDGETGPLEQLRQQALGLVRGALHPSAGPTFRAALDFKPAGARALLDLFALVEEWLRDVAAVAAGAPASVVNRDHDRQLAELATGLDPVGVAGTLADVEEAREQARGNVNPQLIVTGLLGRIRRGLREDRDRTGEDRPMRRVASGGGMSRE